MEKNAIIMGRFIDLLNVLDMRTHITVFGYDTDGKEIRLFDTMPVYQIITRINDRHNKEDRELRDYDVIALNVGLTASILIKKGEY